MAQASVTLKLTPREFETYGLALNVLVTVCKATRRHQPITLETLGLPANLFEAAVIESRACSLRNRTRDD